MTKRAGEMPKKHTKKISRVLDGQHMAEASRRVLDVYDATTLVGLRARVRDAAIEYTDEHGEVSIELPKLRELLVSVAIARCLMPLRLRGSEIKAIRRIMKLTLADLANKLDERTAPETISRWENEAQPMGGYAEKLLRLLICEELQKEAHGVEYNASMIAHLRVLDPWRMESDYEVPYIDLALIHLKEQSSGSIIKTWDAKQAA